jgi:hypothetical protein
MRLFRAFAKSELLCSRSGSRSSCVFFLFNFFSCFFCFFCFLSRLCFFLCISSRSSNVSTSSRSSSFSSISSENNSREGNSYEGGYDCGQNFFHVYYLQKNVFDLFFADVVPKTILFITACYLMSLQEESHFRPLPDTPY